MPPRVQWSPKLTDFLTLILTGERRAMTDSLLSYVGVEDRWPFANRSMKTACRLSWPRRMPPHCPAPARCCRNLQEKTGTWVQGQMQVRGRDGESGLSKLTEAKAPLRIGR
jgi:hypothetical protein